MDSTYHSVTAQTGLYAGQGGYRVTVGEHTQLDGAVIASRSPDPQRNRLETGTLGFSDLANSLSATVGQAGASLGSGMTVTQQALSGATSAVTAGLGHNASDHSVTHAAISGGTLIVHDPAHQSQEVAALSHDVDHAANALTPQFDKAKEQQRLQTLQAAQGRARGGPQ